MFSVRDRQELASRLVQLLAHPIRIVVLSFAGAVTVGTLILMTPAASEGPGGTGFVPALFTATSAVCVTGLVVVDTPTHWSTLGEGVILVLIQAGGLGVMTLASLLALLLGSRLGVRASMLTEAEARHGQAFGGSAGRVVVQVVRTSVVIEAVVAVLLSLRFKLGYGESWDAALYQGLFHAVSAFNNAGFALWSDSLEQFVTDPWVCLPIAAAIILGGIGFPVLIELRRRWRTPIHWSLHAKLTVWFSLALLILSTLVVTTVEWNNPATLGSEPAGARVLAGFFHAVNTRTAGFNSVPVGDLRPETLLTSDVLMFIGGGSGGTAGGIKVTTFVVLGYVLWAEVRGERRVSAVGRTLPAEVQRQAVTVALLSVAAVIAAAWTLLILTDEPLQAVLFEVVSAFGTVGLSTGITAQLPLAAQLLLTVLMFVGRLGPLTLGAALALRLRPQRFEFPAERPIVG